MHQAPVHDGRLYLVGGHQHADNRAFGNVEVVTLTPPQMRWARAGCSIEWILRWIPVMGPESRVNRRG